MKLVVSRRALVDIERLHQFLASNNELSVAERAVDSIGAAIRSLTAFPNRGRPSGVPGIRELIVPFGRSTYVLRYRAEPAQVTVLRVWHSREGR